MNKRTEGNTAVSEGLMDKNNTNKMGRKSTSRIWVGLTSDDNKLIIKTRVYQTCDQ